MASTYSDLKIELIGTGDQSGTWGNTTNTNLGTALEEAISGRATANFPSDADLTLTFSDSNASQVARNYILNVTSSVSLTVTRDLIVPTIDKPYIIENNTTGSQSIRVKTSTGSGITVPNGRKCMVYANSTNVVQASDFFPTARIDTLTSASATLTSAAISGGTITGITDLAIADGGTGASSAPAARTNLGATTVGSNLFTLADPSAITFVRVNADNTVSALNATDFKTAISAANSGAITASGLTQATARLLGRTTAGTGAPEEISVGSGLTLSGGQLTGTGGAQIRSISASVSANALTISASALSLDFRSTTLGSGTVTTVTGTPVNLVISSGSTLGTVDAVQSDIVVLAINNSGTIELAAVNLAGGTQLDETNLISTTAEGGAGAADSATVVYSTTARTNVAYRVLGIIRSTQTTAGTWATAPSLIQGAGGFAALQTAFRASGSAPMYACRAWVNFNGTGTVAIRASGNVSSITDNGVGDYTVNFTTAMPDANYAAVAMGAPQNSSNGNQTWLSGSAITNPTTSLYRIQSQSMGSSGATYTFVDASFVNAAFFR